MTQSATNNTSGLASHYINLSKISDARWGTISTATLRINKSFLAARDVLTVTIASPSTATVISMVDAIATASSNAFSNANSVYTYDTLPDAASTINTIVLA
jgi:hypothetical protein